MPIYIFMVAGKYERVRFRARPGSGKRGVEMKVFMEDCKLWGVQGGVDRRGVPTVTSSANWFKVLVIHNIFNDKMVIN